VPGLAGGLRLGGGLERQHLRDVNAQAAILDEPGQLVEQLGVDLSPDHGGTDAELGGALLRRLAGDGDDDAALLDHLHRTLEHLAAHGVDHRIDVVDDVLEAGRGVVDHLLGAE